MALNLTLYVGCDHGVHIEGHGRLVVDTSSRDSRAATASYYQARGVTYLQLEHGKSYALSRDVWVTVRPRNKRADRMVYVRIEAPRSVRVTRDAEPPHEARPGAAVSPVDALLTFMFLVTMLVSWALFTSHDEQVRAERAQYLESRLCGCPEAP